MISQQWAGSLVVLLVLTGPVRAVELSPYLPEHSEVVLGAEVANLVDAPLVRKHLPDLLRKHGVQWLSAIVEFQGPPDQIDPVARQLLHFFLSDSRANLERMDQLKKTVQRAQLAVHTSDVEERLFVVLQGRFSPRRFAELLDWARKTNLLGCPIRTFASGQHQIHCLAFTEDAPTYVALADERHLLISQDRKVLEQSLARVGDKRLVVRQELQQQAAKVDPRQGLWMILAAEDTPDVKNIHGGIRFGKDVEVQLTVEGINPDQTRQIAAYFRDALSDAADALKHLAVDQPALRPLPDLLRTIQRKEERDRVSLRWRVEVEAIDKLIRGLP